MTDPQYQRLCQGLATAFRRDAELHAKQDYWQIGQGFLHYRSMLRQGGDHRYRKLVVALRLWDAWILARNTDWLEYPEIPEARWAELAASVAADLAAGREIQSFQVNSFFDLDHTLELPRQTLRPHEASPLDDP